MLLISTFGNIMVLFAFVAEKRNAGYKGFFRQNYASHGGNIMSKVTFLPSEAFFVFAVVIRVCGDSLGIVIPKFRLPDFAATALAQ